MSAHCLGSKFWLELRNKNEILIIFASPYPNAPGRGRDEVVRSRRSIKVNEHRKLSKLVARIASMKGMVVVVAGWVVVFSVESHGWGLVTFRWHERGGIWCDYSLPGLF